MAVQANQVVVQVVLEHGLLGHPEQAIAIFVRENPNDGVPALISTSKIQMLVLVVTLGFSLDYKVIPLVFFWLKALYQWLITQVIALLEQLVDLNYRHDVITVVHVGLRIEPYDFVELVALQLTFQILCFFLLLTPFFVEVFYLLSRM